MSGLARDVRSPAHPYREPAPLPWLYRSDPFLRLCVFSIPLVILLLWPA
jgi:hypothetical protein